MYPAPACSTVSNSGDPQEVIGQDQAKTMKNMQKQMNSLNAVLSEDTWLVVEICVDDEGKRLDSVLAERLDNITRNHVQKLIEAGNVTVKGTGKAVKNYRVRAGDSFAVQIPPPEPLELLPEEIPLKIVYEDEDLLVVDKPQGMVVHPAPGNETGTLVNALLYHCRGRLSSINGVIRPGIVHRIDKDTSGLLVVAKNDRAHAGLAEQFEVHSIERVYCTIVYHNIREESGTVNANIGRNPHDRKKMAVVASDRGKRAVTHYKVIARSGKFTFVECRLETGRTHQIRVHMAYAGHPVLGDPLYGPSKKNFGISGQVLHARDLGFLHPVSGRHLSFTSPLPDHFLRALEKTGLSEELAQR